MYQFVEKPRIRYFSGENGHGEAEEFAEDVRRAWSISDHLTQPRKLALIIDNVATKVRQEIKQLGQAVRDDPELLLTKIVGIFGERRAPHVLLEELFSTKQRRGESIMDYSHRLSGKFAALQAREAAVPSPQQTHPCTLRDQFARGLLDPVLVSTLREAVFRDPTLSFHDVRETAARWMEANPQETAEVQAVTTRPVPPPLMAKETTESKTLTEDDIPKIVAKVLESVPKQPAQNGRQYGRDEQGRIICHHCKKPGHIIARCPSLRSVPPKN